MYQTCFHITNHIIIIIFPSPHREHSSDRSEHFDYEKELKIEPTKEDDYEYDHQSDDEIDIEDCDEDDANHRTDTIVDRFDISDKNCIPLSQNKFLSLNF